ncbi:hypothetical protein E5288_WYG009796 [Bos mutus]|uniref:Uncharacterized protein n=1 Tax=Bos mutus TaxID=72004 RepID=A0A6B0QZU7_9CETA|nr:hypothetical protein [Bos mutus]
MTSTQISKLEIQLTLTLQALKPSGHLGDRNGKVQSTNTLKNKQESFGIVKGEMKLFWHFNADGMFKFLFKQQIYLPCKIRS